MMTCFSENRDTQHTLRPARAQTTAPPHTPQDTLNPGGDTASVLSSWVTNHTPRSLVCHLAPLHQLCPGPAPKPCSPGAVHWVLPS